MSVQQCFFVLSKEKTLEQFRLSSRKQAYSNILKISLPKPESFHIKFLILFIVLLKTWIMGTR